MGTHQKHSVSSELEAIIDAIAEGNTRTASAGLHKLSKSADSYGLPRTFSEETLIALDTGDWNRLSEPFRRCEFIGGDGTFLLIGPYTIRRLGRRTTILTAIYGRVVRQEPIAGLEAELVKLFGRLNQHVPMIIPFQVIAACGAVGREDGEAFLVPDGWRFAGSEDGPALNDMGEQRRRLCQSAFGCMRRIFEPKTAELLVGPLWDDKWGVQNQHLEYQYHEAGHASGYGLQRKLKRKLLPTLECKAVEEWRSDGVEFALARRLLPAETAAQLIAANFCIRFGIDAHRRGGIELDVDVNATLLTFDRLLRNGGLVLENTGRLALSDPTHRGLVEAVQPHSDEALQLTFDETPINENEKDIESLYGEVSVPDAETKSIFRKHVVEPCLGLFKELQ